MTLDKSFHTLPYSDPYYYKDSHKSIQFSIADIDSSQKYPILQHLTGSHFVVPYIKAKYTLRGVQAILVYLLPYL